MGNFFLQDIVYKPKPNERRSFFCPDCERTYYGGSDVVRTEDLRWVCKDCANGKGFIFCDACGIRTKYFVRLEKEVGSRATFCERCAREFEAKKLLRFGDVITPSFTFKLKDEEIKRRREAIQKTIDREKLLSTIEALQEELRKTEPPKEDNDNQRRYRI